ncbi:MAG: hypothetical protein IH936_04885 [Acidobacteria bacterium]|nr:hypothetical protein [Acidobacteriota bacterium]
MNSSLHNYLKTHRKRTGLYQGHVARLLGGRTETIVVRHEKAQRVPSLKVALAYAIVYRTSVDELFAGLREETESQVRERAAKLLEVVEDELLREHLKGLVDDPDIRLVPCEE